MSSKQYLILCYYLAKKDYQNAAYVVGHPINAHPNTVGYSNDIVASAFSTIGIEDIALSPNGIPCLMQPNLSQPLEISEDSDMLDVGATGTVIINYI